MRALVLTTFLALSAAHVSANASEAGPSSPEKPKQELNYIPFGNLGGLSPAEIEAAGNQGKALAEQMMGVYDKRKNNADIQRMAQQVRRRADDIADASISAERDGILKFLGIDNAASTALYFFVTWDMPMEMLRSYALDAMWSGGTLVFKGVPPGKKLGDFILKDLRELVHGKGASANLSLDPRLFDAYQVKVAPTIVVTNVRNNFACQGIEKVYFENNKQTLSYDTCPPIDPTMYWKMSGGVSTQFALQSFVDDGGQEVKPFLAALAKGRPGVAPDAKAQVPFTGSWEGAWSPSNEMLAPKVPK